MSTLPLVTTATAAPPILGAELEDAAAYARAEKAASTRRAYRSDFDLFRTWCAAKGVDALPAWPETIAAFLAAEAKRGVKASTIGRRVAAIRYAHKPAGHEPPTNCEAIKATVRGIRSSIGAAKVRKTPIVAKLARAMAHAAPPSLKGMRDRALLLLGFAGAFRRSELVALDVADIEETEDGLRVLIRRSKTDQEGQGETTRSRASRWPARYGVDAERARDSDERPRRDLRGSKGAISGSLVEGLEASASLT
jgi:site-specific recombinase XerC